MAPDTVPESRPVVLVVEDEPHLLDAMVQSLGREFEVDAASSAEEATLFASTRRYDVIVSDQLLPGEPGLEFLMRFATLQPAARRILLTGYINPELLSRSVSLAGLAACIIKPVSGSDLIKAIKKALKG